MRLSVMADQLQLFSQNINATKQKPLDQLEIMVNEEYKSIKLARKTVLIVTVNRLGCLKIMLLSLK